MKKKRLLNVVNNFANQKILVIGDLILDSYLWTTVERISPEAPVPVARVVNGKYEKFIMGGAANTTHNLLDLGVKTFVLGTVGNDKNGNKLKSLFRKAHGDVNFIIEVTDKPTTRKTRIIAGTQQLLRIDRESTDKIKGETENNILNLFKKLILKVKAIIISDYDKGLLTDNLVKAIFILAKKNHVKVFVDPTPATFYKYKNSYVIKPNKKEVENIVHKRIYNDYSNLKEICIQAKKILKPQVLLVSLGKDGIVILDDQNRFYHIKTKAVEVFDVSGAGDTTIAAFASCISAGANLVEAAWISNLAAGIVIGKMGTATCTKQELLAAINEIKLKIHG